MSEKLAIVEKAGKLSRRELKKAIRDVESELEIGGLSLGEREVLKREKQKYKRALSFLEYEDIIGEALEARAEQLSEDQLKEIREKFDALAQETDENRRLEAAIRLAVSIGSAMAG